WRDKKWGPPGGQTPISFIHPYLRNESPTGGQGPPLQKAALIEPDDTICLQRIADTRHLSNIPIHK
ncbi:MAG: hypothetical protein LUD83_05255, partial [Clostridiales bacterium]|nr:hypothetical protein [Clostridiales bacterium]